MLPFNAIPAPDWLMIPLDHHVLRFQNGTVESVAPTALSIGDLITTSQWLPRARCWRVTSATERLDNRWQIRCVDAAAEFGAFQTTAPAVN